MSDRRLPNKVPPLAAWRRDAAKLLDQQLWLFGYDIRRPEGNLLMSAGCTRIAAPAESDCSSCYQVDLATGERLTLRGFGLLCENRRESHAIFLHRDSFKVSWLASTPTDLPWRAGDVPKAVGVPAAARDRVNRLAQPIAHWIADYEQTVTGRLGTCYRQLALEERGKPVAAEGGVMSRRWRQVAADLARWPELIARATPRRKSKPRRAARAVSLR